MKRLLVISILVSLFNTVRAADPVGGQEAVKVSQWNGYERLDFTLGGRTSLLVLPKKAAEGKPWIWRTEFFGHEPQADLALLEKGFHAAWVDVQNLYGSQEAIGHMEKFHAHLTLQRGLSAKPVLEGFSRGGLFALNWLIKHPDEVSCLYLDAPVCDFKSWPAGWGKGKQSPGDWARCCKLYGFSTDEEARAFKGNPVDQAEVIAKAKVPILSVCGDADEAVPLEENSALLKERCAKLGMEISLITKPGGKHHPHSLPNPAPIVEFIMKHTAH